MMNFSMVGKYCMSSMASMLILRSAAFFPRAVISGRCTSSNAYSIRSLT